LYRKRNNFAPNKADTEAVLDALLIAGDDSTVVMTPIIAAPETEPGAAIEFGGGNATPGGIPIIVGKEPTKLSAMLLRVPQSVVKLIKALQCEKLQCYFINQHGQIVYSNDGATPAPNAQGFEIASLFIGDKKVGGFEEPDSNEIILYLQPNWSDSLEIMAAADYDPLIKEYEAPS